MNARMSETPEALFRLGKEHFKAYRTHEAVGVFESLRQADPGFPGLNEAYAKALRRDARHREGLDFCNRAAGDPVELGFERAMNLVALGQSRAALEAFDAVLELRPAMAVAWYQSHAPALELLGRDEAVRRIERALACPGPVNGNYKALLAAYLWLGGATAKAAALARKGRHRVLIDGLAALQPRVTPDRRLFAVSASLLTYGLEQAAQPGLVLEFGVRRGTSLRHIAAQAGQEVHGFDSFEGLPEAWGSAGPGLLTTGAELPDMPPHAHLHPGWFEDTLPEFLHAHPGPLRFVNIDSDLYASARTVLNNLAPRLAQGSVIVFDELIGNPSWKDDEYKALMEFAAAFDVRYEIFALAPATKQAALRIL